MTRRLPRALAAATVVALVAAACSDTRTPVAPDPSARSPHTGLSLDLPLLPGVINAADTTITTLLTGLQPPPTQLLSCPTTDEASARAVIGPLGGSIGARGSVLTLPPGAVLFPTEFEVVVPASPYMEVQVHAVGHSSFQFLVPAFISINFARCTSLPDESLQAVYIDAAHSILELMGAGADRVNKKLVFTTPHLSGYAIAWGTDTTGTGGGTD